MDYAPEGKQRATADVSVGMAQQKVGAQGPPGPLASAAYTHALETRVYHTIHCCGIHVQYSIHIHVCTQS